ncbi:MAG: DUF4974 domain-containing protein [Prevotella sp.]|nr:DUF4974 domain-containing protein [Prevotella sp.]
MSKTTDDKELGFVLRHYRENAFNADKALRKLAKPALHRPLRRWVAAAASLLCLVAFAAVLTWQVVKPSPPAKSEKPVATDRQEIVEQPTASFHFDDTPLPEVLHQLGNWYGVELKATGTEKHLTGDFAADSLDAIIGMIEEVLDVEIYRIEQH